MASAARNGNRQTFVDTVGWSEPTGHSLVIAFVPWLLSEEERQAAIKGRNVYPALTVQQPLVEVRLEIDPAERESRKVDASSLRAIQFTFWYFDDPTPVIRIEKDEWPSTPDIEVAALDGELRRGGYVNGTIRGRQLFKSSRNTDEAYLVNLSFAQSLG